MGQGGGGKTGVTKAFSPYASTLANIGQARSNMTMPVLSQLTSQIGEALRTGGIGARMPIINRALDSARSALSTSLEGARQSLARSSLGRSTFGQRILREGEMAGEQAISQIPTDIAQQFINIAPGVGLDTGGGGMIGAAMAGDRTISKRPSMWDIFLASAQAGANLGASISGGGQGTYQYGSV